MYPHKRLMASRFGPQNRCFVKGGTWSTGMVDAALKKRGVAMRSKSFQRLPTALKLAEEHRKPISCSVTQSVIISERNLEILENLLEASHSGPSTAQTTVEADPVSELDRVLSFLLTPQSGALSESVVGSQHVECGTTSPPIPISPTSLSSASTFTQELSDIIDEAMSYDNNLKAQHGGGDCDCVNGGNGGSIDCNRDKRDFSSGAYAGLPNQQQQVFADAASALTPLLPTNIDIPCEDENLSLAMQDNLAMGSGRAKVVIVRQTRGRWSAKQDELLLQCVRHYGPKWTLIEQKHFLDRNNEALRKRWKKLQRLGMDAACVSVN